MTILSAGWLTDPSVQAVCAALRAGNHRALFVGGCVRDGLMDRPVADIDIATDALPQETIAALEAAGLKAVPTGVDHGTVTAVADGQAIEITTFRRDVTTDGRHAKVAFSSRVEEDAARRDFTMNALYAEADGAVLDPIGGLPDLRAGRLRFIGDAEQRIAEDYLRILRFFRFLAWYADPSLGVDPDGLAACAAGADGLSRVSAERIWAELRKLLSAVDPAPSLGAMAQAGVLLAVLPGAETTALPPLVHLESGAGVAPDPIRRLAAFGPSANAGALRLSRAEARRLTALLDGVGDDASAAECAFRHGRDIALDVALLRAAFLGQPLSEDLEAQISLGANAVFPVRAKDLMPDYSGAALGQRLEDLRAVWIASGFRASRDALLSDH